MHTPAEGSQPRRKKSKNKFKPQGGGETASAAPAAAQVHSATHAGTSNRKKKKKRAAAGGTDAGDVAAQPHAPAAAPQQQKQRRPPPPPAAGKGGGGAGKGPRGPAAGGRPHAAAPPSGGKKAKGSLLEQMRARLQGGRFRWLNEALYTTGGADALRMMRDEPQLMQQYHEGFREQTKGWPVQPVDLAIRWLRGRPPSWAVADLGCGDAKIAATVEQKVHSFDLTPTAPGVVACNMADVPLPDASVDAAVFCLSLMGTDYGSFLEEAARILKPTGWLWVAEVQSRFQSEEGGGGGGGGRASALPAFLGALRALGFELRRKDASNTHFLVLELQRGGEQGQQGQQQGQQRRRAPEWPPLRACQYKKR